jgi:hypothetical protein
MDQPSFHIGAEILEKRDVDYQGPHGHVVRELTVPTCKIFICDDICRGKTRQEVEANRKRTQEIAYGIWVRAHKRKQEAGIQYHGEI